jgi:hypothetical protein
VSVVEVEVVCSDQVEHRRRVESRAADIAGHRVPTWQEVAERDYRPRDRQRLVIDTARQVCQRACRRLCPRCRSALESPGPSASRSGCLLDEPVAEIVQRTEPISSRTCGDRSLSVIANCAPFCAPLFAGSVSRRGIQAATAFPHPTSRASPVSEKHQCSSATSPSGYGSSSHLQIRRTYRPEVAGGAGQKNLVRRTLDDQVAVANERRFANERSERRPRE